MPIPPRVKESAQRVLRVLVDAAPLMVLAVGNVVMLLVDVVTLGSVGTAPLAATALAAGTLLPLILFGSGTMTGLDGPLAQAITEGRRERALALVRDAWIPLLTLTVLITAAASLLPLLWTATGADFELIAEGKRFLWARLFGVPAQLAVVPLSTLLLAARRKSALALSQALYLGVSMVGTVVLVLGTDEQSPLQALPGSLPSLGTFGFGAATSAGLWVQALVLGAEAWRMSRFVPRAAAKRSSGVGRRVLLRTGLPAGLHASMDAMAFGVLGIAVARLGVTPTAVHEMALTYLSCGSALCVAFGRAGAMRVGIAQGAEAARESRLVFFTTLAVTVVLTGFWFIAARWGTAFLLHGWGAGDAADGFLRLLPIIALVQLGDGLSQCAVRTLRVLGLARFALAVNLAANFGLVVPLAFLLAPRFEDATGIWTALALGTSVGTGWLLVRAARVVGVAAPQRYLTKEHLLAPQLATRAGHDGIE